VTNSATRQFRHILMDWDGTTSLVRAGWAEIMTTLYVEQLPPKAEEAAEDLRKFALDEVMRLNGRPSIHQAVRLVELVTERGGEPLEASAYQADFQHRLGERCASRLAPMRIDPSAADTLLVPGARAFFERLRTRGIPLTLATGTPLPQALEEAELLGLAQYFDGRIFGPVDTHDTAFSKREIIQRLLRDHGLKGSQLLAFGDGPVEIAETVAVGGFAVAVASDETHPGRLDEWKRDLLRAAGAHAVIADYTAAPALLAELGL
jgi:phosphoglycolate phosphatase-like HAD superfamily hydrolase